MKKSEIKIGKTYVGKNGKKRKVVALGGIAYAHQIDTDTIQYVDPDKYVAGRINQQKDMTRASFASWAVEELN